MLMSRCETILSSQRH